MSTITTTKTKTTATAKKDEIQKNRHILNSIYVKIYQFMQLKLYRFYIRPKRILHVNKWNFQHWNHDFRCVRLNFLPVLVFSDGCNAVKVEDTINLLCTGVISSCGIWVDSNMNENSNKTRKIRKMRLKMSFTDCSLYYFLNFPLTRNIKPRWCNKA